MTKTFNKDWRNKLVTNLFDIFGIKDKSLSCISDFRKDRCIRAKFNYTLSKTLKLIQGLSQRSALIPFLFSLFLAVIEKVIATRCEVGLFVDDIILWYYNSDIYQIESIINCIDVLSFDNAHKLSFNTHKLSKLTVSFFTANWRIYNYQSKITVDNSHFVCENIPDI